MTARMSLRTVVFWLHLVAGIVAGVPIFVMSFTGVVIAFEREVVEWVDRDVRRVDPTANDGRPREVEALLEGLRQARPGLEPTTIVIPRDPTQAYVVQAGRSGRVYVDPYTGEVRDLASGSVGDVLHRVEAWHRWLGFEGERRGVGKLINGVCNLAFVFLCVSGAYLWLPRRLRWTVVRPRLWFDRRLKGRARDLNWHEVVGFWNVPVLLVLSATAVVFSFRWAHELVFTLAGEQPPAQRGPGAPAGPSVTVPPPPPGASRLTYGRAAHVLAERYPERESIAFPLPKGGAVDEGKPLQAVVLLPAAFQARGRVQVDLDPYRGDILQAVGFGDRSAGARARTWIRFLHTGEAFGLPGKVIAALSTALSLLLVYTGFALSWRRFQGWRKKRAQSATPAAPVEPAPGASTGGGDGAASTA